MKLLAPALGLGFALTIAPALAATTPPPAQTRTIKPAEAAAHLGENVAVEALIGGVHRPASGREVFLDIGGRYPNNLLSAVVFKSDFAKFSNLDTLAGKKVHITGAIKLFRGKPEIVLSDPAQLRVTGGA